MINFLKKYRWLSAGVLVVVLGLSVVLYFIFSGPGDGMTGGLRVYYYNPSEGKLQGVNVSIPTGTPLSQINEMLARFYNPPSALTGLWPAGMRLAQLDFYRGLVGIALPYEFNEMSAREGALFRTALTLTFIELPFVERVLFWVVDEENVLPITVLVTDDEESPPIRHTEWLPFSEWLRHEEYWGIADVRIETALTVANDPSITPGAVRTRTIMLYFVCAEGEGLVTETIEDDIDVHRLAELLLNKLIAGSEEENVMRIIPTETRVRMTEYDGAHNSLYIDLSGDFASRFIGSPALASLMLQSIVNTLTSSVNNEGQSAVDQVFFLIDSNRYEVFHGVNNFDLAFRYDQDITLVPDEDYEYPPDSYGYNNAAYSDGEA